jgi:hypothetical protein
MNSYPSLQDRERIQGITWDDLTSAEPRLVELLSDARRACSSCRQWAEVELVFASIRSRLAELIGFTGKNNEHPVLGSPGAYKVAYCKLFDALAEAFASLECGAEIKRQQPKRETSLTETIRFVPTTAA